MAKFNGALSVDDVGRGGEGKGAFACGGSSALIRYPRECRSGH